MPDVTVEGFSKGEVYKYLKVKKPKNLFESLIQSPITITLPWFLPLFKGLAGKGKLQI